MGSSRMVGVMVGNPAGIRLGIRPPQNGATLYQNGAVPGRSRSFLERARPKIIFGTERPGTRNDRFRKKLERGKIFGTRSCPERGRSWVQAQHRNGSENDLVSERAYEFQSGIFSDIGRSTGNFPMIFRLESPES